MLGLSPSERIRAAYLNVNDRGDTDDPVFLQDSINELREVLRSMLDLRFDANGGSTPDRVYRELADVNSAPEGADTVSRADFNALVLFAGQATVDFADFIDSSSESGE